MGDDAQQLQQMVLHHVAQRTGLVVERPARFNAQRLCNSDLHMTNAPAAPQRLEQRIAETQCEQVLHRLLAEVVIDAEDLRLAEDGAHMRVDPGCGGQVLSQRLLEHHA